MGVQRLRARASDGNNNNNNNNTDSRLPPTRAASTWGDIRPACTFRKPTTIHQKAEAQPLAAIGQGAAIEQELRQPPNHHNPHQAEQRSPGMGNNGGQIQTRPSHHKKQGDKQAIGGGLQMLQSLGGLGVDDEAAHHQARQNRPHQDLDPQHP